MIKGHRPGEALNGNRAMIRKRSRVICAAFAALLLASGLGCTPHDDASGDEHDESQGAEAHEGDHASKSPGALHQESQDSAHHDHDDEVSGDNHHEGEASADHDHEDPAHEHERHSSEEAGGSEHHDHAEELRVTLSPAAIEGGEIEVAVAEPRTIDLGLDLPGEVVLNADRLAHVVPRFPGIAKEVRKALGDHVAADEVLAVIESNESLALYEVRSMISGTVTEKHITLGEFVQDDEDIFVVADLSTVWVNITVYARDIEQVRRGQTVKISVVGGGPRATAAIDYIAPALGETTRAATARAVVPNPSRVWRQGMFVNVHVVLEEPTVPVAVLDAAIQRIEGEKTVFVQEAAGVFEGRRVTTGRSDGEWTEIVAGLNAGERYVSEGSFLLKSELMKSEAGHAH